MRALHGAEGSGDAEADVLVCARRVSLILGLVTVLMPSPVVS